MRDSSPRSATSASTRESSREARCRRSGVTGSTPSVIASSCDLRAASGVRRSCATSAAHWPRRRSSSTSFRCSTPALFPIRSSSRAPPPAKPTPRSPAARRASPAASPEACRESRDENRNATPTASSSATPAPAPPTTASVRRKLCPAASSPNESTPAATLPIARPSSRSSTGTASAACRWRKVRASPPSPPPAASRRSPRRHANTMRLSPSKTKRNVDSSRYGRVVRAIASASRRPALR